MTIKLTKQQKNVLSALCHLPAAARYRKQPGAVIQHYWINGFDGRTINALQQKGLLEWTEFGLRINLTPEGR